MKFFRIKSWAELQHYKDRSPPWIKLYNHLLDDYEFACLQDASKLHLVLIWLLASRNNNRLPFNPRWIKQRIGVDSDVDLDELVELGFIEIEPSNDGHLQKAEHDASKELATRNQDACLEKSRGEGKTEGEEKQTPAKPEFSDKDMELAQWMLSLITEAQPDFKKPNLQSWAKTIRLMRERDGRNHHDMARMWKWAREDDFWQANVLSADKFRKQYDRLVAQAMRPGSSISQAQKDAQREQEIQDGFLSDAPPDEEYHGGIIIDHEGDNDEPF